MPDYRARVEDRTFVLLTAVASAASKLEIDWLIAGAAGRVLLLEEVYKLPPGRATEDVDYGVMVDSWDHYQALVELLCKDARIFKDKKETQRLRFSDYGMIDLIPFGGVESDGKDAPDIAYILHHGATLFGETNLFEEHFEIVESAGYDLDLATGYLLGLKMGAIASQATRKRVSELLDQESNSGIESKLVREVARSLVPAEETRIYELLSQVRAGLAESCSQRT